MMARGTIAAILGIAAVAAAATPAYATTTAPVWQCRASSVWTSLNGNGRVEPIVANGSADPTAPDRAQCAGDEAGLANLGAPLGLPPDLLTARAASATTTLAPELGNAIDQQVRAAGAVVDLTAQLPPGGGGLVLGVGLARSEATASCQGGAPALAGTSRLAGLTINGQPATLDDALKQIADALAPLHQLVALEVDEQVTAAGSLVQRALHLRIVDQDSHAPVLELIAGEAKVGSAGEVCNRQRQPCPEGSGLDSRGRCVLVSQTVKGLVVGSPGEVPTGGKVISLTDARKKYDSPCLSGAGPSYVVVATSRKRARITGTNRPERILGLGGNDSIDGGRGADCIDGGPGADGLTGGIGGDRLYGMAGSDHLNGGTGSDRLYGGRGNDTINAAFGRDRVYGGPGRDYLNAATAGPAAFVSCGQGRGDTARVNYDERHRVVGCERTYVVPDHRSRRRKR
jgi:RTX calcium-binding nonapeptide repeat (4 copies)